MKIKYRFWGCLPITGQALTRNGWKFHNQLAIGDDIMALDPDTDEIRWEPVTKISLHDHDGMMRKWDTKNTNGGIKAMSTHNHRWLMETEDGQRYIGRSAMHEGEDPAIGDVPDDRLILGGGTPTQFAKDKTLPDEVVESVAWYICDASDHENQQGFKSIHISGSKPHKLLAWRRLAKYWAEQGGTWREGSAKRYKDPNTKDQATFYLGKGVVGPLHELAPDKEILPEFLSRLTLYQAQLFHDTLMAADGHENKRRGPRWTQLSSSRREMFQMLCAMLGIRTKDTGEKVTEYRNRDVRAGIVDKHAVNEPYQGQIWCPTVDSGIWMTRDSESGQTFWTGNTSLEGTRQVFTFTEILTDEVVEEYLNDELIDSRPNPIGVIPVLHTPNLPVSGSPWGTSDCHDIISINRQFNEISTDVADIINYHSAPITIITGAKASQLEKGAKKVWAGLPKDSNVFNLEGGGQGLKSAIEYLEVLKRTMHELVGIPETALGQMQPISNTSGVALAIQFQPLMIRYSQKVDQYGALIVKMNELILLTLGVHEPQALVWDETKDVPLKEGQAEFVDLANPESFKTEVHFAQPLPLDKLVLLNEIQAKMSLGLESREGSLRLLGEEFPEEKLAEIREELAEDAKADGVVDMIKTQIANEIAALTGTYPGDPPMVPQPPQPVDVDGDMVPDQIVGPGITQDPAAQAASAALRNELLTAAYGTKTVQWRTKDEDPNS